MICVPNAIQVRAAKVSAFVLFRYTTKGYYNFTNYTEVDSYYD